MISLRFGIIVSILLVIATVPTIIHTYIGVVIDDKLQVKAVSTNLAGLASKATTRQASWVKDTFNSHDWMERRYIGPDSENVLLFIARSYDLKRLYHHPEIGILRGVDLKKEKIESLLEMSGMPIHVLKSRPGKGLAAYVLLYDGQFIRNPILLQFLTSIKLLFSPRKSMTIFFVYDSETDPDSSLNQSPAISVLTEAVKSFLSQRPEAA